MGLPHRGHLLAVGLEQPSIHGAYLIILLTLLLGILHPETDCWIRLLGRFLDALVNDIRMEMLQQGILELIKV